MIPDDDDLGLLRLYPHHEDNEGFGYTSQTLKVWPELWPIEMAADAALYMEQKEMREWLAANPPMPKSEQIQRQALEQLCNESGWQVATTLPDGRQIYLIR